MTNLRKNLFEMPYKDVFYDMPEDYVRKEIEHETKKEKERVKSKFEKLLLFLKLKKPWQPPRHIIYHSKNYKENENE